MRRPWLPWLAALAGIVVSLAGAWQLHRLEQRNTHLLAEDEVSSRTSALEGDVRDAISLAMSTKAVFDASRDVTREEFATLARLLSPRTAVPGSMLWLPRVRHADRARFEHDVRQSGITSFLIYETFRVGVPVTPALDRDEYFPLLFMEPPAPVPLGFDPGGDSRRLKAMQVAVDNAAPAADRLGDPTLPSGFALDIIAPVYQGPTAPETIVARRGSLRGFVGVHMDLASFVNASLTRSPRRMTANTWLLDEQGQVLCSRIESRDDSSDATSAAALRVGRYAERVVQVADRKWSLIFHPEVEARGAPVSASLMVLGLGLLSTVFVALYLSRLLSAEQRLEALVEERTAALRATHDQLQQAQKMEAVGRLTGGIAHDFNNLLTIVMGNLALAKDAVADPDVKTTLLQPALEAAERGADLTQRLLAFSRRQALQPRVVDVAALVEGMRPLIQRTLAGAITFDVRAGEGLWTIRVDPSQLEASLLNLCINARDAMPGVGQMTIGLENTHLTADAARTPDDVVAGDYVLVSVTDTGKGMTDDVRARAFEPFFTTKRVGKGSGLGLSMVFGFVKQSHGDITIDSAPGHGTTVRMYFPRAKES